MQSLCYETAVESRVHDLLYVHQHWHCNKDFPHTHANMHTHNISPHVPVHREMHPKSHPIWICPVSWSLGPVMSFVLRWMPELSGLTVCVCVCMSICVCEAQCSPQTCAWFWITRCVSVQASRPTCPCYNCTASRLPALCEALHQSDVKETLDEATPFKRWKVCFWACFKGIVHPKMKRATWHLA